MVIAEILLGTLAATGSNKELTSSVVSLSSILKTDIEVQWTNEER